jgi:ABC-type multidrug transport system permease subunit
MEIDSSSVDLDFLKYLVGVTDFLGVALPIVLAIILLLSVLIVLLGRLLGVSRLVSAFVACAILIVLLFPWQAFLMNQTFSSDQFRIPGVLYTWSELVLRARLHPDQPMLELLYWARFVGWPVAAIALLLKVQHSSGKGLGAALRDASPLEATPIVLPPANP